MRPYSACCAGPSTLAAEEPMSGSRFSWACAPAVPTSTSRAVASRTRKRTRLGRMAVRKAEAGRACRLASMPGRPARGVNPMLIIHGVPWSRLVKRRPGQHPVSTPIANAGSPMNDESRGAQPPITLYTSAICGYCVAAKNFLRSRGLEWEEVRIDLDPAERERMVARTRRSTVPQIFVGEVHVGGYDDMMALHRAGKFDAMLAG